MADAEDRSSEVLNQLRQRGYRVTPQRAAVLDAVLVCADHPTVEQIHERVRATLPMTSLATVYKALAVLKEVGAVCELQVDHSGTRYDARSADAHAHVVCVDCGAIVDLDIATLPCTIEEVEALTGYRIDSHRHEFFGACPACAAEAA